MPNDDDSAPHHALHVLGDAIGAAVAGVANTLGQTVGTAVQTASKLQEATVHVLPGAGTGLTAEEYVQHAPDKQHDTTLKASEQSTLDALQSDKTGVAISHGQDLSAPVSGEQAQPKVQADPVPEDAVPDAPQGHAVGKGLGDAVAEARNAAGVVETVSDEGAAKQEGAPGDGEAAVHGGHEQVADDDETLRALLDRPPPVGFEDPIAKIPLHHEPAPSLHLPGEQEDAQDPYALPDHLDRGATEAAWNAPERPGDTGDPAKPSFAAVVAAKRE